MKPIQALELKKLDEQIYLGKLELFSKVALHGLNNGKVLKSSQELDKLINEYQRRYLSQGE